MLTLLSEIHFWTSQNDICIKDTDYGTFRYHDRKDNTLSIDSQSKKTYAENRSYLWNLKNKRPTKLKDKLKELEEQILQNRIVCCQWVESNVLLIILCTGLIINVFVNVSTGGIQKITFDKYLMGKLQSECISDVLVTKSHLLCAYNDSQMTVVHFTKRIIASRSGAEKLARFEPKLQVMELAGPTGRKLERKLNCNSSGDKLLVWWRCTRDEVYPWSPLVKDQDRANIHIYNLSGLKLELICYRKTEFDPIGVSFSATHENLVHCVEQKVSRKGAVTVETCTYEISKNRLQQASVASVPLQTQVCCYAFSPNNEKLLLGCIDASVVLFDQGRGITHLVKAGFIPTMASWHSDGAIIMIANDRCQMQCFDISLACIRTQTISEDSTPASITDLSTYFKHQPMLSHMAWNKKSHISYLYDRYLQTDSLLLLFFDKGPLTILRLLASCGAIGDVHTVGLTADVLVTEYVLMNQIDKAIGVLLSLNWDTHGTACLVSLHRIIGHLLSQRLTPELEAQIQRALGSFYAPLQPINDLVREEFGEQVKDLTRKFFHLLVRYQLFEKAFSLAIDINDYDLFMDLYYYAQVVNDEEMASAALNRAKDLINRSNSSNDASECSRSSCSQCSESESQSESEHSEDNSWTNAPSADQSPLPPLPITRNRTLPLPPATSYVPIYTPPLPTISMKFPTKPPLRPLDNSNGILKPVIINFDSTSVDSSLRLTTPSVSERFSTYSRGVLPPPKFPFATPATKEIVHKTVSLNIPPAPSLTVRNSTPLKMNVPLQSGIGSGSSAAKNTGEKNVKFSDTVTAFIVPEISRNEKVSQVKDNKYRRPHNLYLTDPKRELADSLPLCHPNDEYLKDFTPISNNSESEEPPGTKIKVVHFGMV